MVRWVPVLVVLGGCVSVEPSGDVFAPRPVETHAPAPAPTAPAEAGGTGEAKPAEKPSGEGFDFEGEDRPPSEAAATPAKPGETKVSPAELYEGLGLGKAPEMPATTEQPATPTPAPTTPTPGASPWPPIAPPAQWGVRLVSTVPDAQPPRAILGLADGREAVVTPGMLVPDAGVVVLAIGRDAVQVATVVPQGDHALVQTQVLNALYPGQQQHP